MTVTALPLPHPQPRSDWAAVWLDQTAELLAATDLSGALMWVNAVFTHRTGLRAGDSLLALAAAEHAGGARAPILAALGTGRAPESELALVGAGEARLWVRARLSRHDEILLWTLQDTTALHRDPPDLPITPALAGAAQLANLATWRHDLATGRVRYDAPAYGVLGLACGPDGQTLAQARSMVHPDDVESLAASSARAIECGHPVDAEVRHRRSDGVWRHVLVRQAVERDTEGEPVGIIGVSIDLTELVDQQGRAPRVPLRLDAAADAARIGIWTTVIGTRETEWNEQMYSLFEMDDLNQPPSLLEWLRRCIHVDDRQNVESTIRALLRRDIRGFELEFRTLRRYGGTRWMLLRADLERNGAEPPRIFGIAMDVTDRHESLSELHAASQRAALIASHAGIGTWESNIEGSTARWDDQMWRLRGLAPRPWALDREERLALVHPEDRLGLLDKFLSFGPESNAYEFRVLLPDGTYRWLASRSVLLLDDEGRPSRRVGVNWDITDAKSAELAHQQSLLSARESQAKTEFLSRMSHELRTPLNAVLGFTQLLQLEAQVGADDGQHARLEHIRFAGEHLLALVNDALDLSSLQAGNLRLEPEAVTLSGLIDKVATVVGAMAGSHGVQVDVGPLEGKVTADPARLHQALLNLLSHAIRHSEPGGRVCVTSEATDPLVRIDIHGTGPGTSPDQTARLFEPFSLGAHGKDMVGSGVGLAIARALIEGMGGKVSADSALGQGTRFSVLLPPVVAARAADAPPHGNGQRRGRVLYIEDNSVNVLLVEELVASLPGLDFAAEPTGADGVARAHDWRPDLILVDLYLPDFDGFEVLKRLRADPATASIACIALSANALPEDIARGLAAGFDDYWTKPIQVQSFLQALQRLFPCVEEELRPAPAGHAA